MSFNVQEITHFAIIDDEDSTTKFEVRGYQDGMVVIDETTLTDCGANDIEMIIQCLQKFKERFLG